MPNVSSAEERERRKLRPGHERKSVGYNPRQTPQDFYAGLIAGLTNEELAEWFGVDPGVLETWLSDRRQSRGIRLARELRSARRDVVNLAVLALRMARGDTNEDGTPLKGSPTMVRYVLDSACGWAVARKESDRVRFSRSRTRTPEAQSAEVLSAEEAQAILSKLMRAAERRGVKTDASG